MPIEPNPPYISSKIASKKFGITNDHIGLLCRRGKITGLLWGRVWYVNEDSLDEYLKKSLELKEARKQMLSKQWKTAWTAAFLGLLLIGSTPQKVSAYDGITLGEHVNGASVVLAHGGKRVVDTLTHWFGPQTHVSYARDFEAEASERLARLSTFNNFLSRVNEEMFNLYAKSAGRLMTAAAFDADAAEVIVDKNFGWFTDTQVRLSISAAAALSDAYNRSLDAAPLSTGTISVAESDFDTHLAAAVENSVGALFWKNAVSFVSSLFSSTDILAEKFSLYPSSNAKVQAAVGNIFPVAPNKISAALTSVKPKQYPVAEPATSEGVAKVFAPKVTNNYVTQDSLNKQFEMWFKVVRAYIAGSSHTTTYVDNPAAAAVGNLVGGGNVVNNYFAAAARIDKLDNVTITNATLVDSSINGVSDFSNLGGGASALTDLSDTLVASPAYGNLLMYNGIKWVNIATSSLGFSGSTNPYLTTDEANSFISLGFDNGTSTGSNYNSNFFGSGAGYLAINASNSNFFGAGAGNSASDANDSNFFGNTAGQNAANAYNSNFLGSGAGDGATNASNSNFLGYYAGVTAIDANYSNFIGYSAGYQATNAYNSNFFGQTAGYGAAFAPNSNFIGNGAGYQAIGATSSNFIGWGAGVGASSASKSNFFGVDTGAQAIHATYSNFFGNSAGQYATNAENSNFIGSNAGYTAINAYGSNFLGEAAGYQAAFAPSSNFIGYYAGYSAVSATSSNFIGTNTGIEASNAAYSTFIGGHAGYTATNAANSVFLGQTAGYAAANAAYSLFLGYGAGANDTVDNTLNQGTSIVIGKYSGTGGFSNSISLGHGVKNSAIEQLNIGNVLYATGLYGSDDQSASPTTAGKFGVGTSSPFAKLSVHANDSSTDTTLFAIASSTALRTTTLFSISNIGVMALNREVNLSRVPTTTILSLNGTPLLSAADQYYVGDNGGLYFGINAGGQDVGNGDVGSSVGIGSLALNALNSGYDNTAVGYHSLYRSVAGSENTALGANTLGTLVGNQNVAVGAYSLGIGGSSYAGGINHNTSIGYFAGRSVGNSALAGGSDNTFLGYQAGQNITAGSNNIAIGFNTVLASATAYNQLNLGNLLFGTLPATTSGTTLSPPTSGSLGVGSTSPFAKFSIHTNNGDTATTLFAIGSSTASAITTLFSVSNTGNVNIPGTLTVGSCSGCGGGVGNWFTPNTNYGALANSTSTPIWFQSGIFASSTSRIASTTFAINGNVGIGSSSPISLLSLGGSGQLASIGDSASPTYIGISAGNGSSNISRALFGYDNAAFSSGGAATVQGTLGKGIYFNVNSNTFGAGTAAVINTSGNFGIGTTSPFATLSIFAGGTYASQAASIVFAVGSSTAGTATSTLFSISSSGFVTIAALNNASTTAGSSSYPVALEVQGDIVSKGLAWTSQGVPVINVWNSVAYGNGMFVGVGANSSFAITSNDGITWTSRTTSNSSLVAITYGNGMFVAVAQSGVGNRVATSPDGITWTNRLSAADISWQAITYGNGLFVAVSTTGTGNRVMTSPDGINWTSRASAADNDWNGVTYGNGLFVAVGGTGGTNSVMTSPDGLTWTSRTDVSGSWNSVTYSNGMFVAVGSSGSVMTSPDGITWTSRTAAASNTWTGVTYGNGLFVAVSSSGTGNRVMTSPDGINWTSRASAANNSWKSVVYGNGMFVAISSTGTGNRIMTSGKADYISTSNNNVYQGGFSLLGGNFGIGTSSPFGTFSIHASVSTSSQTVNTTLFQISSSTFSGATSTLFSITNTGIVGIGTSTLLGIGGVNGLLTIDRSGTQNYSLLSYASTTNTITHAAFANINGVVGTISTNGSATAYNTSSDRRIKAGIATTSLGLSILMQLPVREFSFIRDQTHATTTGFIAQELFKVFPYAVTTNGDDGIGALATGTLPWSVDYGRITPLIVKAVQDIAQITSSFKDNLIAWLADASNGITKIFAKEVQTDKLCVGNTCVTEAEFLAMIAASGSSPSGGGSTQAPTPEPEPEASSTPDVPIVDENASSTPPVVTPEPEATSTPEA